MKKPAAKKLATKSTTKVTSKAKAAPKKFTTTKAVPVKGTVGWLIEQLQKFPADMSVLQGDHDSVFYEPGSIDVLSIREGEIDDSGDKCVCINAW